VFLALETKFLLLSAGQDRDSVLPGQQASGAAWSFNLLRIIEIREVDT
jgi:hypothetical protein